MRIHQKMLAALSFCLVAVAAVASPSNPRSGAEYLTLPQAQPTESGKKVEVTEFFSYACPHCNAFEAPLESWVKKEGDKIAFKRVPLGFYPQWVPLQHLYYALEAMGKSEEMQLKVFHAIHVEHKHLENSNEIADFVASQGIDKQKFMNLYNSFGVETKVRRTAQLQQDYQINGVPTVAIDGRYLTSPGIVGATMSDQSESEFALSQAALSVMTWLVDHSKKK